MKTIILLTILGLTLPANAAEWRCVSSYNYGSSQSRCGWVMSAQERYERGQANAERNLDHNSQGGTRRASDRACKAAIEAGVENDVASSYGCRE